MSHLSLRRATASRALLTAVAAAAAFGPAAAAQAAAPIEVAYSCTIPGSGTATPVQVEYTVEYPNTRYYATRSDQTVIVTPRLEGYPFNGTSLNTAVGSGSVDLSLSVPGSAFDPTPVVTTSSAPLNIPQGDGPGGPQPAVVSTPVTIAGAGGLGLATLSSTTIQLHLDFPLAHVAFDFPCTPVDAPSTTIGSVNLVTEDEGGLPTPSPVPVTPTPTPTPAPVQPTPSPAPPVRHSYYASGSVTLKNLAKGSVPVADFFIGTVTPGTGAFSADLALTSQAPAKLTALGFLPVTAQLALVSTGPTTGTLTGTSLSATTKVRIKLPSISVLGVKLAGGANCQSAQISTIPLNSVGAFSAVEGGTLAGTFSISNLTGCGALNGLVSTATSGSGNAISLAVQSSLPVVP